MRVGRTLGLWAAMGYVSTADAPSLPSLLTQAGSLSFEPAQTEDLMCAPSTMSSL